MTNRNQQDTPVVTARLLINRNIAITVASPRSKAGIPGWDKMQIAEDDVEERFGRGENLAVCLGHASLGLVDADLDCAETRALGPDFLPPTGMAWGRKSNPSSHFLYRSNLCETEDTSSLRYQDIDGKMLLELRIGANDKPAMTLAPGSTHPSGELVQFYADGDPSDVDGDTLKQNASELAAAAILARHWPDKGGRHDAALTIDGYLTRLRWPMERRRHFIRCVATVAGDDEVRDRVDVCSRSELKLETGKRMRGITSLRKDFGKDVADRVSAWLGHAAEDGGQTLAEMNLKYAVVKDGGRVSVLTFDEIKQTRPNGQLAHTRKVATFMSFADFRNFHLNHSLENQDGKKVSLGEWWLRHKDRRTVTGLVFRPGAGEDVDGRLNLW